jgi:hypothetical protein
MATSTISALRSALVSLIEARLTTDAVTGVTVSAWQIPNMTRQDHLMLGGVEATQEDMTYTMREETYDVEGTIWIPRPGSNAVDASTVETRALVVFASVESALTGSPSVTGTVFDAEIRTYETNVQWFDDGWVAGVVVFNINVQAHL